MGERREGVYCVGLPRGDVRLRAAVEQPVHMRGLSRRRVEDVTARLQRAGLIRRGCKVEIAVQAEERQVLVYVPRVDVRAHADDEAYLHGSGCEATPLAAPLCSVLTTRPLSLACRIALAPSGHGAHTSGDANDE